MTLSNAVDRFGVDLIEQPSDAFAAMGPQRGATYIKVEDRFDVLP